jgi:hypothetical protein
LFQIKHEKSKQFSFLVYIHPFIFINAIQWDFPVFN